MKDIYIKECYCKDCVHLEQTITVSGNNTLVVRFLCGLHRDEDNVWNIDRVRFCSDRRISRAYVFE